MMSSQWNEARQAQFERWEASVCSQIEMWSWAALGCTATLGCTNGAAVDEILRSVFLKLESEKIQKFVEGLIGKQHRVAVRRRSR
jgi:hypothetical protein